MNECLSSQIMYNILIMADYIKYHDEFASIVDDDASRVFEITPKVFSDSRGSFSEVLKTIEDNDQIPNWFRNQSWIKQINRSVSSAGTVRGCHAQRGEFCQGKLVEAVNARLYDIIIDARPDSQTYGHWGVFVLDSVRQNKLWVPRGFLHSFVTSSDDKDQKFIFQYFCDNVYSHEFEFGVSPLSVIPNVVSELKRNSEKDKEILTNMGSLLEMFCDMSYSDLTEKLNLSEKDLAGEDCSQWLESTMKEYKMTGKVWYR